MKKKILLSIIAAIAGIAITLLLTRSNPTPTANVISVPTQQKKLEKQEQQYEAALVTKNQQLKVLNQKKQVVQIQNAAVSIQLADVEATLSEQILSEGSDSLKNSYIDYKAAQETADSLTQQQISLLEETIITQDTLIELERSRNTLLKSMLDTAFRQQEILTVNNLLLQKKLKKVKRRRTWGQLGLFVLAGTASTLLITR
ncbi:MAG TPA: hypothetical protein VJ552_05830 [Sediminibacterium sp.]|nr:hypothetical protein [Sediminibacterium sp.]